MRIIHQLFLRLPKEPTPWFLSIFNELNHYHYHVFPRFKDDGFSWTFSYNSPNDISDEGNKIKDVIDHLIKDERS